MQYKSCVRVDSCITICDAECVAEHVAEYVAEYVAGSDLCDSSHV